MPTFYALVDAMPGREHEVGKALGTLGVRHVACKEKSHDYLIKFEAAGFDKVDDYLQTHIRRLPGVSGVEIVVDWGDHSAIALAARDRLA